MALILLSGFPCCGKTTFANKLKNEILKRNDKQRVVIVNEEALNVEKLSGYMDSTHEKFSRGLLKAAVDREVSVTDTIVISDSLNYIKGYRYELYCIARALRLVTCCVYVEAADAAANRWNSARREQNIDTYTDEILQQLRMRYEFPNDKNRWENPLFHVRIQADAVADAGSGGAEGGSTPTVFAGVSVPQEAPVPMVAAPKKSSWKPKGAKKAAAVSEPTGTDTATTGAGASAVWFSGSHVSKPIIAGGAGSGGEGESVVDNTPDTVAGRVVEFIFSSGGASKVAPDSSSTNTGNTPAHPSPAGQAPNASTTAIPHAQANILYELDRVSALITNAVVAHVKLHPVDSAFSITDVAPPLLLPEYDRVFDIHKQVTVAELHRHRRQFVKVNTLCPPVIHSTDVLKDNDRLRISLGCMFIDFLSAQL